MKNNIILAATVAIAGCAACWFLSGLAPPVELPNAPDTDLVRFGDNERLIGQIAAPTNAMAMVYDANKGTGEIQEVLILDGTWIVPETMFRMSEEGREDAEISDVE